MEKEPYELCDHEYTTKLLGWKTCLTCGLCLKQHFSHEAGTHSDRVFIKNTGPDHVVEIREKMRELMDMVVRRFWRDEYTDEIYYIDPPGAGLPYEFHEHPEELCQFIVLN